MTERHRVPDNVHLRICLSLTIQALLSYLFRFEGDHVGRRRAALWNTPKIFLRESRGIAGLKVSDKNHRDVLRRVIERKEFVRLRFANGRNVRRPAHGGPAVRMRFPDHCFETFLEFAKRRGFRAHAALFEDYVAFGIEFAEDGIEQALGFHPHPEFELISRNGNEMSICDCVSYRIIKVVILIKHFDGTQQVHPAKPISIIRASVTKIRCTIT